MTTFVLPGDLVAGSHDCAIVVSCRASRVRAHGRSRGDAAWWLRGRSPCELEECAAATSKEIARP